ncbi:MAG: regulatory protein RecX, partial [Bacillota bacterium]
KNKAIVLFNAKEYEFSKDIIFKESLYEKKVLSLKEFFEIKEKSDCLLAQNYLFRLLSTRLKSQKEAEQKLRDKGFFSKAVKYAIKKANEYKLLDDDNYAKCYVNTYIKNKGSNMIRYELMRKGIEENIIEKHLEGTSDMQKQSAIEHAKKYLKIKGDKATKEKLYKKLYSKGYKSQMIVEVLSEIDDLK